MTATDLLLQIGLILTATGANTLSAFAGGGAGLVQLPALILMGLPFPVALATHKLASVALGIGASGRHLQSSTLNGPMTALILGAGLPGVWLGAQIVLNVPDRLATSALAILTLGLGLYSSRRPELGKGMGPTELSIFTGIIGSLGLFAIGLLNGSLTSGTGLFVTLWLVRWFGLSYTAAVAHTLVLVGLGWNGTGALVLGINGDIHWSWLPALILGALFGGYLGAHLSLANGNKRVKQAFEALALLMGVSLLVRSWLG